MKLEIPVSGVLTSCATPAASRPSDAIFSEICSCSSRRDAIGHVLDEQNRSRHGAWTARILQRHGRRVDEQAGTFPVAGQGDPAEQRHLEQRRAARMVPARGAERLDERPVEYLDERSADRVGSRHAVEGFERVVPADDALVGVEHHQPIVERFENVVVELAHPPEFLRLEVELAIEPAVLDGGRHLRRDRREQREIFAIERLVVLFAAQREHGDGHAFENAGHEVIDALIAPELDLFG